MGMALFLGRLLVIFGALMVAEVINLIVRYVKYKRYRGWKVWYTFKLYMRDEWNVLDGVWCVLVCIAAIAVIVVWILEPLLY